MRGWSWSRRRPEPAPESGTVATCGVHLTDALACARPSVETLVFMNPNIPDLPVCRDHLVARSARWLAVSGAALPPRPSEDTCQACGGPNPAPWAADNALWNRVAGSVGGPVDGHDFLCPTCFVISARRVIPGGIFDLTLRATAKAGEL